MEVKYQILLNNNPRIKSLETDYINKIEPISIEEIMGLENGFNNGQPFPRALRELLYLAGKTCYVLNYIGDSQMDMQIKARSWLTLYNRSFSINRPYFVIDVYAYKDNFLFVYLDENVADPIVYSADLEMYNEDDPWPQSIGLKLTELINQGIEKLKSGYNPF